MPRPSHRSRSLRRVHVTTPGGNSTVQYRKRKPSHAKCGACGVELKSVPRKRPFEIRGLSKTKKRPQRPFGGVLCSACMRKKIVESARND